MSKTTTKDAVAKLVAAGFSPDDAQELVNATATKAQETVNPKVAALVALGFDQDEAVELAAQADAKAEAAKTPKEKADALVENSDYEFTKGRVYLPFAALDPIISVLETGEAQIVPIEGDHYVKALLVWTQEPRVKDGSDGTVVVQNLK